MSHLFPGKYQNHHDSDEDEDEDEDDNEEKARC